MTTKSDGTSDQVRFRGGELKKYFSPLRARTFHLEGTWYAPPLPRTLRMERNGYSWKCKFACVGGGMWHWSFNTQCSHTGWFKSYSNVSPFMERNHPSIVMPMDIMNMLNLSLCQVKICRACCHCVDTLRCF